jgi:hypothetical protein
MQPDGVAVVAAVTSTGLSFAEAEPYTARLLQWARYQTGSPRSPTIFPPSLQPIG